MRQHGTKRSKELPEVGTHHDGNFHTYFAHKIAKLRLKTSREVTHEHHTVISSIFKGCIIFVNGATNPPKEELRRLISIHGGEFVHYQAGKITHLVCNLFTDGQLKQVYKKVRVNNKNILHNVTDQWIMDSIAKGKRQYEIKYLPSGLNDRFGKPIDNFMNKSNVELQSSNESGKLDNNIVMNYVLDGKPSPSLLRSMNEIDLTLSQSPSEAIVMPSRTEMGLEFNQIGDNPEVQMKVKPDHLIDLSMSSPLINKKVMVSTTHPHPVALLDDDDDHNGEDERDAGVLDDVIKWLKTNQNNSSDVFYFAFQRWLQLHFDTFPSPSSIGRFFGWKHSNSFIRYGRHLIDEERYDQVSVMLGWLSRSSEHLDEWYRDNGSSSSRCNEEFMKYLMEWQSEIVPKIIQSVNEYLFVRCQAVMDIKYEVKRIMGN